MHNCIMSFTVILKKAAEVQSLSPNIDSLDGVRSPRGKCCIEKPRNKMSSLLWMISTTTKNEVLDSI